MSAGDALMSDSRAFLGELFSLEGKVAIVTGATGLLGGAIAEGLARAGASVGVLGRRTPRAQEVAAGIEAAGGEAVALTADVVELAELEAARDVVLERWGRIDILVNAAGGIFPEAMVGDHETIFDIEGAAFDRTYDLNFIGTLLPTQVFGASMVERVAASTSPAESGSIVNISSVSVPRALTRAVAYSAAKAAIENFTRWLAAEMARKHDSRLRVNAIAPGFYVSESNKSLLLADDGTPTERGRKVLEHTPAGRFGDPRELVGAVVWLCSPSATFVNGAVVPVDGGLCSYSGI
jgi:NAD(P)-dependent dehydrogenase (short-subunit alcohol dehydrogenase family)